MTFLSDLLYVDIDTTGKEGLNITYRVWMQDAFPGATRRNIYVGQLYARGEVQRIYLNDIVNSYLYNNSYAYLNGVTTTNPKGCLFNIIVEFEGLDEDSEISVSATPYIMNYYKDKDMGRVELIKSTGLNNNEENVFNALDYRSGVYPRIPNLSYKTKNMYLSYLVFQGNKFRTSPPKLVPIKLNGTKGEPYGVPDTTIVGGHFDSTLYSRLTSGAKELYLYKGTTSTPYYDTSYGCKIADVDSCPADYYLMWVDRTGGWMCWPFDGRITMSEDVTSNNRVDMLDKNIPYEKIVNTKWALNSKPLSYKESKALESIFTSPVLYLFNSKIDETTEVMVNTKSWTDKTMNNTKGIFNLSLEVQTAASQNIRY